jgi:hypothetical protein
VAIADVILAPTDAVDAAVDAATSVAATITFPVTVTVTDGPRLSVAV